MNFDIKKTLELIKGGLMDPPDTATRYLAENPNWKQTLVVLTGPMIIANVLLSAILWKIFGGYSAFGPGGNFFVMLFRGLLLAALGFTIAVLIFNFLAGVFKGKPDFSRAFAAVSLAAIPAWVAGVAASVIPFLGVFVSLAGAIWSLILLYRIFPLALAVPAEKRVVHFVVSLVAIIIVNFILGAMLTFGGMRPDTSAGAYGQRDGGRNSSASDITSGTGVFGQAQRQAELIQAAGADAFDPPANGKVTRKQARELVAVIEKSQAALADRTERLKKASDSLDNGEVDSAADLVSVYQSMGTVVSLQNVELEVVKTGGGNWAEYRWVKEQLRVAKLQMGSGSEALEHNYELYEEFADVLGDVL